MNNFESIKNKLEKAFLPYTCRVESLDYGLRIRFAVFDAEWVKIHEEKDLKLNEIDIDAIIKQVKEILVEKGYPIKDEM
ncbi:hypothetical protein ACFL96_20330 [Thermoproteota archaeon]